jgi:hypothetical protein
LNKFRQLAAPDSRLIYYVAEKQSNSQNVIREFWESQNVPHEILLVPSVSTPLNHYARSSTRKLNPLIYGMGIVLVEKWKWALYPFDAFATPYLGLAHDPPPDYGRYFVVQSDAGTMKYRGHKNWLHTGWIEDFVNGARGAGLKCVLVGTRDVGIRNADYQHFTIPLRKLFGILKGAEFVLGLQGFTTLVALSMGKRVLLSKENFRVIVNYFHPRWFRHGRIFNEPNRWPPSKTTKLLNWALAGGSVSPAARS